MVFQLWREPGAVISGLLIEPAPAPKPVADHEDCCCGCPDCIGARDTEIQVDMSGALPNAGYMCTECPAYWNNTSWIVDKISEGYVSEGPFESTAVPGCVWMIQIHPMCLDGPGMGSCGEGEGRAQRFYVYWNTEGDLCCDLLNSDACYAVPPTDLGLYGVVASWRMDYDELQPCDLSEPVVLTLRWSVGVWFCDFRNASITLTPVV